MNIKTAFKKVVLGNAIQQEYLCTSLSAADDQLNVFLTTPSSKDGIDVSNNHIFLGYKPLIIGIYSCDRQENDLANEELACLSFVLSDFKIDFKWKGFPSSSDCVARIILKSERTINLEYSRLYLFSGVFAEHKLLSPMHQVTNRIKESLRNKGSGNVSLPGNLYEQVKVAYSIKRQISIITLGSDDRFNMFPTDLHGPIGENFYIGSLRHSGKACSQVQNLKSICLSSVDLLWCKRAYDLGKNHVRELHALPSDDVSPNRSAILSLPLPISVLGYRELRWKDFYDFGIHRIFFYDVLHEESMQYLVSPLAHIHRDYVQWRNNSGLSIEYLLR